ncbi:MAG: hypothetical protein HLUCCA08_16325 [Rhodobacteraceae bacterium HLUCCA08]|nr:MAG: hypothetical protein HLUCCA08_16325 [Rhodobacteraceae bacterium HLUCCA08]
MALRVEHELHERRRGKNLGMLGLLVGFIALVFGLTVVKVLNLPDIRQMERFDHVARPALEPGAIDAARERAAEADAAATAEQGQ